MKALISAFTLLAFVGASTVPFVAAQAQTQSGQTTTAKKPAKKTSAHKSTKKKTAKKKPAASSSKTM